MTDALFKTFDSAAYFDADKSDSPEERREASKNPSKGSVGTPEVGVKGFKFEKSWLKTLKIALQNLFYSIYLWTGLYIDLWQFE